MQVLTCAMQTERAAKQTNALDVSRIVPVAILPSPKGLRIRADNNQDMLTQNREQGLKLTGRDWHEVGVHLTLRPSKLLLHHSKLKFAA